MSEAKDTDSCIGWVYVLTLQSSYTGINGEDMCLLKVGKASHTHRSHVFERIAGEIKAYRALGLSLSVKTVTGKKSHGDLREFIEINSADPQGDLCAIIEVYGQGDKKQVNTILSAAERKVRDKLADTEHMSYEAMEEIQDGTGGLFNPIAYFQDAHMNKFGYPINPFALGILMEKAGAKTELILSMKDKAFSLFWDFCYSSQDREVYRIEDFEALSTT